MLAAHLLTSRRIYTHHGLYIGGNRVIHYAGLSAGLHGGPVEEVSLQRFAHGRGIRVRAEAARFDREEVLQRARQRLGERHYRVLSNNCEHFCEWCLRGESRSRQVESVWRWLYRCVRFGGLPRLLAASWLRTGARNPLGAPHDGPQWVFRRLSWTVIRQQSRAAFEALRDAYAVLGSEWARVKRSG